MRARVWRDTEEARDAENGWRGGGGAGGERRVRGGGVKLWERGGERMEVAAVGVLKEIRRVSDPDKAQIIWDGIKVGGGGRIWRRIRRWRTRRRNGLK